MMARIPKSHAYPAESLRYTTILDGAARVYPDGREVCVGSSGEMLPPYSSITAAAAVRLPHRVQTSSVRRYRPTAPSLKSFQENGGFSNDHSRAFRCGIRRLTRFSARVP